MRQSINVLHIIDSAGMGGGERYVLDLMNHAAPGFKHAVVIPHAGAFEQMLREEKHPYAMIDMGFRCLPLSVFRMARLAEKFNAHIIHAHGYRANFIARMASLASRSKTVSTTHVSLYDYIDTPAPIRRIYLMMERLWAFRTSIFIAISEAMNQDLIRLGIRPEKIRMIHNGVDMRRFYPRSPGRELGTSLGIDSGMPVIGTIGRMVSEKGQIFLIHALEILKPEFPFLKCLFVGDGPLSNLLKNEAENKGVASMCVFTGVIRHIETIYPLLDIFVLPSLREPFGLVLLEAMACAVPVIASNAGGPRDILDPGVTGEMVPAGNAMALADKIRDLLINREKAHSLASNAALEVEKTFSIQHTVRHVEQAYGTVVGDWN